MKSDDIGIGRLGFSRLSVACYDSIYKSGPTLASKLADDIGLERTHVYPILKQLEEKGFVRSLKTELGPTYYSAVPVEEALDSYFVYQKRLVLPIIRQQRRHSGPK